MLSIQVLGSGLIPRGYGIAPRKEFFKADLNLITTILSTNGLKVNMKTPDGKIIPLNNSNVKKMWDKYRSDNIQSVKKNVETPKSPVAPVVEPPKAPEVTNVPPVVTPPVDPVKPNESKVEEPKVEVVKQEEKKVEEKKEEKVETPASAPIKPVINDNKGNNNQNNNKK